MSSEKIKVRGNSEMKKKINKQKYLSQYKNISERLQNKQVDFANLCYDRETLTICENVWKSFCVSLLEGGFCRVLVEALKLPKMLLLCFWAN